MLAGIAMPDEWLWLSPPAFGALDGVTAAFVSRHGETVGSLNGTYSSNVRGTSRVRATKRNTGKDNSQLATGCQFIECRAQFRVAHGARAPPVDRRSTRTLSLSYLPFIPPGPMPVPGPIPDPMPGPMPPPIMP